MFFFPIRDKDDWTLKQCGVKDGTKLFLVVKKEDEAGSTSQTSRLNFWDELHYFLLKHYKQGDAKLILENFTKVCAVSYLAVSVIPSIYSSIPVCLSAHKYVCLFDRGLYSHSADVLE